MEQPSYPQSHSCEKGVCGRALHPTAREGQSVSYREPRQARAVGQRHAPTGPDAVDDRDVASVIAIIVGLFSMNLYQVLRGYTI